MKSIYFSNTNLLWKHQKEKKEKEESENKANFINHTKIMVSQQQEEEYPGHDFCLISLLLILLPLALHDFVPKPLLMFPIPLALGGTEDAIYATKITARESTQSFPVVKAPSPKGRKTSQKIQRILQ